MLYTKARRNVCCGGVNLEIIVSKDNKKLKLLKSLSLKKNRDKTGLFSVEGKRMTNEALKYAGDKIEFVYAGEIFANENKNLLKAIDENGISVYTVKDNLLKQVSDTVTPQGIGAVLKMPDIPEVSEADKFVLVLDGVSEPGNLGTIIRTAEAAGIDRVYMMKGCADIFNPKVVRSTMGSIFRVPFICGCTALDIKNIKNKGFEIISSSLGESMDINEYNKNHKKRALVIGSEAFGVSDEILAISDKRVHIPMCGKVESLNAAVAAGILMYMI